MGREDGSGAGLDVLYSVSSLISAGLDPRGPRRYKGRLVKELLPLTTNHTFPFFPSVRVLGIKTAYTAEEINI
jgi:hypothetical protein